LLIPLVAAFSSEDVMKYPIRHVSALAALMLGAFASTAVAAGQDKPLSDPADANASVPPTHYEPLLRAPPASTGTASPAGNWKALNRAVASYDSMSLTMDMAEPKPAEPAIDEPSAAATGMKPTPAPVTQPDPHAHHQHKELK
jgi:hypothetical protein